jgi:RNA polymerase sigma-70 factor (ECF subfamily)
MLTPTVVRAQRGDPQAMQELLVDLAPSIQRFAQSMCRHADDAEEVLQDALLAVATHLGEYEGRASLSSWVFAVARSACSHRRRGRKNQPHAALDEHDVVDLAATPEARAERAELDALVARAVDALPEDQREVVLLRDVEGLDANEAASVLEISVEALKSRLHRARRSLHASLRSTLGVDAAARPDCPDVLAAWSRKLEGDLQRADCAELERHLSSCARCSAVCDALKREIVACSRSKTNTVGPDVRVRVERAVGAWREDLERNRPRG